MQGLGAKNGRTTRHADDTPVVKDSDWAGLLESTETGIGVFQMGRLLYTNAAFRAIFGLSASEEHSDPLARQFAQSPQHADLAALLADGTAAQLEFHSEATHRWYNMTLSSNPACPVQMMAVCTDISAFRRRDELLAFANKMEILGQLASGVAHDFNNILSIIEGYGRMMLKAAEPQSKSYSQIERILQATRRGAGITHQLLTFGRQKVATGGITELGAFLREQQSLLEPLLDARIHITIDVPNEPVHVACNEDMLAQILVNAVTNARDAMEETGGQIMIVAGIENRQATIAVHDTGTGMDAGTLARAPDPFFTTKSADKGTGLGLTQIYRLLLQMGGTLDIHSESGRGTSLVVRLPLSSNDTAETQKMQGKADSLRGQTVLVVDDEPDLVAVLAHVLRDLGLHVLTAQSGLEALTVQDEYKGSIHWLLSDVVMRDMSGPKLAGMMTKARPNIRPIYMSGYPSRGNMARIQLPEDALYLVKPVDPQRLRVLMQNLLTEDNANAEGLVRLAGLDNT